MIRRFAAWLATAACAISLLGASYGFGMPTVVVYPITATGANDPAAGGNISLLIANKLAELGGVTVKPATPGTERAKFLEAARAAGADYYVTGFLTPIGADSSLIVQVVSTSSGSVVYSTTAVVRTYADAVAQSDTIHDAILRHAGRGFAALDAPPPAPSSGPSSVANGSSVDIGKALRKRGKAGPPPAASATIPSARALLFVPSGSLDDTTRTYATAAIARALRRSGIAVGALNVQLDDRLAQARAICNANPGATALYVPVVVLGASDTNDASAQIDLTAYDCSGKRLGEQLAHASARKRRGIDAAIDAAAASAAAGFAKTRA